MQGSQVRMIRRNAKYEVNLLTNQLNRPSGVAAAHDAPQIRSKLWKELGNILTKEAPETAAIWVA